MSDESSSDSSSISDEESLESFIGLLKPFDFEPEYAEGEDISPKVTQENSIVFTKSLVSQDSRIGNNEWCTCGGLCRSMETANESLCCCDTNEIPDNF